MKPKLCPHFERDFARAFAEPFRKSPEETLRWLEKSPRREDRALARRCRAARRAAAKILRRK